MTFKDTLVYYYLILNQYFFNYYNLFKIYFIGVENIKIIKNNKVNNLLIKYIIYNFLNKLINLFDFVKKNILKLRNYFDINVNELHITKLSLISDKTVILDNKINKKMITFEIVNEHLRNLNVDNIMLKTILINFDLVNGDQKICLKKLSMIYNDINGNYNHTLKNILIYNYIFFDDNSQINIKIFKDKKINNYNYLLKDIFDEHINFFI